MLKSNGGIIRVLVADDSPVVRQVVTGIIHTDPQLQVVGSTGNGREAVELVAKLKPDVITMDMNMPGMDGFEATKQIMAYHPTPILILSSTLFRKGGNLAFQAMTYGALDVMDKEPFHGGPPGADRARVLTERLKQLARIKVVTHPLAKFERRFQPPTPGRGAALRLGNNCLIAIATSTGGPQALVRVLKAMPEDLACGVVIVQHISEGFDEGLAEWLDSQCPLTVQLGFEGAPITAGFAYIAPSGSHMRVTETSRIHLTDEPPRECQKPSATLLFESVAQVYGPRAVCAILTGMGSDGVDGLKLVKAAGGRVVAQDEATSVVFGMPKVAIEAAVVDWVCPIDQVAPALLRALAAPQPREVVR